MSDEESVKELYERMLAQGGVCICGHAREMHGGIWKWCTQCECSGYTAAPTVILVDAQLHDAISEYVRRRPDHDFEIEAERSAAQVLSLYRRRYFLSTTDMYLRIVKSRGGKGDNQKVSEEQEDRTAQGSTVETS